MTAANTREPVSVHILDREFTIGCTPGERDGLLAASSYLEEKMREIKRASGVAGFDRLAVLAALTIATELLDSRERDEHEATELARGLSMLRTKLDAALPASLQ